MDLAFLKKITKILAIGAGFTSLPLIAALADVAPPWPTKVAPVSACLMLMASILSWEFVRGSSASRRRNWVGAAVFTSVVGLIAYLSLYATFVETIPQMSVRIVKGFTCLPDAQLAFGRDCPFLTPDEIATDQWTPEGLWTAGSILAAQVGLLIAWFMFLGGLVLAVGATVADAPPAGRRERRSSGSKST